MLLMESVYFERFREVDSVTTGDDGLLHVWQARWLPFFDIVPMTGVDQYEARIVNPVGRKIFAAKAVPKDGRLAVLVDRLPAGSYWVRVFRTDDHDPIAEYGLRVR